MLRELVWRAIAAAVFAVAVGWSLIDGRWAVAGITGILGLCTIVFLGIGFVAWRRGLLRRH